jgi:hypothetical protein
MLIKGINDLSKACVLIALKNMFDAAPYYGKIDWGEEFLVDYFIDYECCTGFGSRHNYLIEESAPVKLFQHGWFSYHYNQADYFRWYDRTANIRYRLPGHRNVVLSYVTDAALHNGHAVCIPASEIGLFLKHYELIALMLPLHGLIVDQRTFKQDFPNEY